MYDFTIIIPTFREELNIQNIITELDTVFKNNNLRGEILVVDDNSPDRTAEIVREIRKTKPNVNILSRFEDPGLSQSVVAGFIVATSDIFIIIDADSSHPPELIPSMYYEISQGYDLVIGSRYMAGGEIENWPFKRRILSFGATFLGRLLFPYISDPVSGFFAVRKKVVLRAPLKPSGYKILLEILGRGDWERVLEIPFKFIDRKGGTSKLKLSIIVDYVIQVWSLTVYLLLKVRGK